MLPFTRHIFLRLLFFVAGFSGARADNPVLFSSFFAEKDLSSQNITCFLQDRHGHMWIGTNDGLNYFDGKSIRVFKHDRLNKNSLPDNLILTICEDRAGNIWIGSSWGVSKLDPELLLFENFQKDSRGEGLGYKTKVYVDKDDQVWVIDGNLFLLNKAGGQFEKKEFPLFKHHAPPRLYSGIFQDSKKRYWITTSDNLYRYFPDREQLVSLAPAGKSLFFLPMIEDRQGNLYCGTWNDGLFKINVAGNTLESIEDKGLHGCYALQELNGASRLWYGNALSSYDAEANRFVRYRHSNTDPYSCREEEISALYTDAQNQLWIGYATKGVQIVSPANQFFKTYTVSEKENMFPFLTCFIRGRRHCYAGGWYNYALVQLDEHYKPLRYWKTLIPGLNSENNISDGWVDPQGSIWLTSAYGLLKFNEATGTAERFRMDSTVSKNNRFLQIAAEGDSVLWLTGYFNGLSRFSLRTKKFQNWGAADRALFWSITRDTTGMLWLANNNGVLTGFDPLRHTFTEKSYTALTENSIYSYILYDPVENALWIATSNGLLRVDRKTFKARLFTEKDNLPTSQVNALQFDSTHHLWIATNKGLCLYEPKQQAFKSFFSNNGLPGNVLNMLFQLQPGNELFIGFKDGFSVLPVNAIPAGSAAPKVIVDKLYESGRIVPIQVSGSKKSVELNYDQDNLHIEFSSNDLVNSEDNQLLFRLEGFDNAWHTAQNGMVNYSKLAPGNYLFHVSGSRQSGSSSVQDDYLAITIHPPFWKQAWFLPLIAILLFGLTLLAARYVFTRNLREKILRLEKVQAIEKERNRISQDMHDELGSGLTKISIMSEVAIKQLAGSPKTAIQLETISSSARELVDNLQDIIWVLNPKNDSLENLCAYLREYTFDFFEHTAITVRVDFPEAIPAVKLSEDQRRNLLFVFKETFNNISRHSGAALVTIELQLHPASVLFTITDNGKGFDKNGIRNFANGLQNMQKRMASIGGSFSIRSSPGQGTRSEFNFNL